jgi:glycosyltransferase involved in cell wall biosynthesis
MFFPKIRKQYNMESYAPHIAILIPLYNGVEYIEEAIKSVIGQSIAAHLWELIIGVNGHPPNSKVYRTVCDIARKYPNSPVRVIDYGALPKPPCGKSATLNCMVEMANPSAQWIAILDADDIWLSDKLKCQLRRTYPIIRTLAGGAREKQYPYDVIGTQCEYIDQRGALIGRSPHIPVGEIKGMIMVENPVINSSALIRRELAHWDEKWESCEDYELWLRLNKGGATFYNCAEYAVLHRIYPTSAFNGSNKQKAKLAELRSEYAVPCGRT